MNISRFFALMSLGFSCAVATLSATAFAASSPKVFVEGKNSFGDYTWSDQPGSYFRWTAEPWTGNEAPFTAIRKKVESQVAKGAKPLTLLASYRAAALKKPGNSQAQFAWAYSAYVARRRWQPGQDARSIVAGVTNALEQGRSPRSAQYARMRLFFILWEDKWSDMAPLYLKNCLFRLSKRDPQDFYLKYVFAYKLAEEKETLPIAAKWAQEHLRQFPKEPKARFLLGRIHDAKFNIFLSEREANEAIGYYKEFLSLEPRTSPYRKTAEWHINDVQHWVGVFRSKGWLKS